MSYRNDVISMVLPEKWDIRQFMAGYDFKATGKKRVICERQTRMYKALVKAKALQPHFSQQQVVSHYAQFTTEQASKWVVEHAGELLIRDGFTPRRLFVGRKQFNELARCATPTGMGPFSFDLRLEYGKRRKTNSPSDSPYLSDIVWSWMNLTVEMIPWMDGVLVI